MSKFYQKKNKVNSDIDYLLGTSGFRRGELEVEPVTLHRKPFMNTVNGMRDGSAVTRRKQPTLGRTAVHGMDPVPTADTTVVWAGRHVLRDLEDGVDAPDTLMIDAEDGQILGLDAVHVGSVRDGKGATLQIVYALKRKQVSGSWQDRSSGRNLRWLQKR